MYTCMRFNMTCGIDTVALGQNKLATYKYQYHDNCSLKLVTFYNVASNIRQKGKFVGV